MSSFSRVIVAGDADGEARARERVAADEGVGQAELAAEHPHLVLEQLAQGLDELHLHALGQAADIVVALDGDGGAAGEGDALDHVRIERALRQEIGAADLLGLLVEHVDEELADGLALDLRVGDALQRAEEQVLRLHVDERDVVVVAEQRDDLLGLGCAQQAVVDEDAGELVADGLVDQHRGHGGIDAAGQAADHPAGADLGADARDGLLAEGLHGPVAPAAGDVAHEVADQLRALRRVHHLRMELHGVELPLLVRHRREGRVLGHRKHLEALRQLGDPVAVAHPDGIFLADLPDALEERALGAGSRSRRGRTRNDARPRPRRRAAPPWSAGRSRCRRSAGRSRTAPAAPAARRRP